MSTSLDTAALDTLFNDARTHSYWQAKPVDNALLEQLYALTALGPTSANCSPARFVFVTSAEGKEKLKPALSSGNLDKTMSAPVTVIVAWDREFYEQLPALFPHADARSWFTGSPEAAKETAFRNSSLQAGYLILRRVRWVWMPVRCPGLIRPKSMTPFSPTVSIRLTC